MEKHLNNKKNISQFIPNTIQTSYKFSDVLFFNTSFEAILLIDILCMIKIS